jgi:hypothetical protein
VRKYTESDLYDLEKLLIELGTGEAAVTILSEGGVPTPVVQTRLRAPRSSMAMVSGIEEAAQASSLWAKYGTRLEEESAAEQLAKRIEQTPGPEPPSRDREPAQPTRRHTAGERIGAIRLRIPDVPPGQGAATLGRPRRVHRNCGWWREPTPPPALPR